MPKAWKDVIASQQYQSLPSEQKAAAQEQYFNEVVAPQAGDRADVARQQFFSAYPLATEQKQSNLWQDAPQPTAESQGWGDSQPQTRAQQIGSAAAETGRGLLQAGVNVANIPAQIVDAFSGAAAWAGEQLGIGDGSFTPSPRVTTQDLEQDFGLQRGTLTPQTEAGKIFAEALPYLTPIGAERIAANAPSLAGRASQLGSRLIAENTTGALAANSGQNGTAGGVAGDLALGVAAGGLVNAAAKGITAGARAIGSRGVEETAQNLRNVLTQGVQPSNLDATAAAVARSPESSVLSRNVSVRNQAGDTASASQQAYRAAEEVRPNQGVLDAAKRLGVDDLLIPSHYSNNPTYRAIEQGLKSVPASQLAAQEGSAIASLAQKADDLIEMSGGQQSRVALSDKFKAESVKAIDSLAEKSDRIYAEISSGIAPRTPVDASTTLSLLRSKADDLNGVQNLSSAERSIISKLSGRSTTAADGTVSVSPPTYALLDNTRKQIGAAISKGEGPFKDQTTAELRQLYSAITDDQERVAAAMGLGEKWSLAKSLVSQRKQLEENITGVLGKDLSGSISSKLTPAVQNLRKGNVQQFNSLINSTPPQMRQEVVASALNDAFTLGSRKEQQLNIPGFVDWYAGAQRNGALSVVQKHLPEDVVMRLKDLYTVANGIRTAKSSEITTGRIQSLLDQFDKDGGMVSKIYNIGKRIAAAEGATTAIGVPGAGTASVIAASLTARKTARTVAADRMISSPQFRNLTRVMAGADSARLNSARQAAEKAIARSRQYQRWAATLEPAEKQALAKVGLIGWLNSSAE